ncbi:MAG: hypothetical protein IJI36_18680, partial [Kiritimatiellae bacterium]|nr:hypothetical protein [Kiritimatiellia bacterium]
MTKKLFVCMAAMGIAGGLALSARAADPYVESDGTQGVVLDYHVNPKTKIVVDFTFLSPLTKQWRLFGVEGASEVFACIYISNGNVYSWSWKNSSGNWSWTDVPVTADRRTITLDGPNKSIEVVKDGVVETNKTMLAVTATSTYPLGLFGDTTDKYGSAVANKCKARIYSFKIYEDDALVVDLEPWTDGNGTYALKDVLSGKVYPPMSGGNPFAGGGDFACTSEQFTWTGAESTDWNEAGNWQVDGAVASWPPQYGDAVSIAAGSTVMIGDAVGSASPLVLSGGGIVTLSGHQTRLLAETLSVETGTSLSLDGTVYVTAATYGGATVAAGRYAGGDLPWLTGSGMLVVGNPGASVADGTLILDVPEGQKLAYYTQLASPITKVVKLGAGTAVVSNDNNSAWVGTVDVKEGILEAQSAVGNTTASIPVFGRNAANTITVFKGAQLHARVPGGKGQTDNRFENNLVLAGDGPDGFGALRMTRVINGYNSIDKLFMNVTLTDDASVYNGNRMGFSSGTADLGGHVLSHRARPSGSAEFMLNGETVKNGHVVAKNNANLITQGTLSLQGTEDNTLTIEDGSTFSMWNTTINRWDWTLVQKNGSQLRAGAGTTADRNRILGPIVLESGTVTVTNYSPNNTAIRMNLAGPISGAGKMVHNGSGHAYLMNGTNTWKGGLQAKWGTVWGTTTGSIPHGQIRASGSGTVNFVAKDWDHAALHNVLTNWDGSGAVNVYTASGENVTDSTAFEHATYYRHGGPGTLTFTADTTPDGATKLYNGEGEMVVAGNKTRRLTRLNVTGGTMTLENAGYIWCGTWDMANDAPKANATWTVGGTNTNAPAKMIIKSGSTLDAFVPSGNNTASYLYVQDTGTKGAILEVRGGALTNWIGVGHATKSMGALYQYGGEVRNLCHAGYDGYVGRYANSYGYVDLMGGLLAMRGWWRFGGEPTAVGVMRMTGGMFKADNCMVLSFGGWGELYMTGGTYDGGTYSHLGEQQYGTKSGGQDTIRGLLTLGGDGNPMFTITSYLNVCERTNTFFGAVNLNAGVLSTPILQKSSWNKSLRDNEVARAFINFGGGAWQAYTGNANIFGSGVQRVNRVTVFPGGATLDINGKSSSNGAVPFEK